MEYVRQYQNRINWENEPSIATPINETNLNKMDKALNYMDGKMLEIVNAIGNDKNVRNAMITSVTQPRTLNAALDDYSGADQLADGDILVVKSTVEGTPTTGWILNIALTELMSVSVNLYSYNSVMFDASIQAGYGLIIKLDVTNSKGYVIGIMNDNGYVRQGKKSGTTVGSYATIDGYQNTASGHSSRAGGQFNVAGYTAQEVIGKYNDNKSTTLFEVGNGTSESAKSNAFEVYANGDAVVYGTLKDGNNNEYLKGIVPISKGGTGNADGYIRTGLQSGETAGTGATAEGAENIAQGDYCHVEGYMNTVTSDSGHAEGMTTIADGLCSHAEGGYYQSSSGVGSWAEGDYSHAEGADCHVTGDFGHGEGWDNTVSGEAGHAEGAKHTVSGSYAHAEGYHNTASGASSHADGIENTASGQMAHVSGEHNIASQRAQFVIGKYNDNQSSTLFEVGNGTANNARSNAFVVQNNGNIWAQGDAYVDDVNARGELTDGHGNVLSAIVDAISEEKTVSGNPIVITDALPVPAKSLTATLEPIQDLHGYDHPWAGGAGKNKLSVNSSTLSGAGNVFPNTPIILPAGTYTLAITVSAASSGALADFRVKDANREVIAQDYISLNVGRITQTFTINTSGVIVSLYANNTDAANYTDMQIESGSTATSYEPYSNICPISGRTEARVDDVGKNVIPLTVASAKSNNTGGTWDGNVYTIHGGKIEVLSDDGTTVKGLKINGTFSAMAAFAIYFNYTAKAAMTLNGCPSGGGVSSYQLDINSGQNPDTGSGSTIAANTAVTNVRLRIGSGFTASGQIIKPMLSYEGGDYEPYRETVSVTIQLGQTVYGGTVDFDTGVASINTATKTYTGETDEAWDGDASLNSYWSVATIGNKAKGDIICNEFKGVKVNTWNDLHDGEIAFHPTIANVLRVMYSGVTNLTAFRAFLSSNPMHICYELATPITIQLTPSQLQMLKGYNRVTMDNGSISLTYKANRLDALLALMQTT